MAENNYDDEATSSLSGLEDQMEDLTVRPESPIPWEKEMDQPAPSYAKPTFPPHRNRKLAPRFTRKEKFHQANSSALGVAGPREENLDEGDLPTRDDDRRTPKTQSFRGNYHSYRRPTGPRTHHFRNRKNENFIVITTIIKTPPDCFSKISQEKKLRNKSSRNKNVGNGIVANDAPIDEVDTGVARFAAASEKNL